MVFLAFITYNFIGIVIIGFVMMLLGFVSLIVFTMFKAGQNVVIVVWNSDFLDWAAGKERKEVPAGSLLSFE
jgi:hypothetical protein